MRPLVILGCIASTLCLPATDIAVSREGSAFRISGPVMAEEIAVYVGEGDVPPVLGSFAADGAAIVFRPRFDVPKTIASRVVVKGQVFRFPAEKESLARTTAVERVYPTADEIPANQLKFYIQFSAPMHAGDAWQHLKLLDAYGHAIELAFLEIDQELWDRDARRLTVLFDPGRIKRGVLPRDEVGASLEAGKSYTLVAGEGWRDERRVPLRSEYRKTFKVIAEDRTAIEPAKWKITAPKAATREALTINFGESIDAALALRLINIPKIPGQATLGPAEREWRYVPDKPWPAGAHEIEIDTALEDLAGNKVGRSFDVDIFDRVTVRTGRGIVRLPFRVE
ncbi:MAG: hypothetical protein ACKV2U_27370 [Bryobacteraceae bacterium]